MAVSNTTKQFIHSNSQFASVNDMPYTFYEQVMCLRERAIALEKERDALLSELEDSTKKHFLYGYHFCRMNGFLFDEQLQSAAEEYVQRVAKLKDDSKCES